MKHATIMVSLIVFLMGCSGTYQAGYHQNGYRPIEATSYFPAERPPTGKKTFVFSPRALAWAAYDEAGMRVKAGKASGGVDACPEDGEDCRTVVGRFRIQRKGGYDCVSQSYPIGVGGAPMHYCMFFHGGYAIHGSPDVPDVHASHGCIRIHTHHARWLNEEFLDIGSIVEVENY